MIAAGPGTAGWRSRIRLTVICLAVLASTDGAPAQMPAPPTPVMVPLPSLRSEPITPIPPPPVADPRKLALGERLFADRRLSHDGSFACTSCHDVRTNGSDGRRHHTSRGNLVVSSSVFDAALNFRFNWEGNYRTIEALTEATLKSPLGMGSSIDDILGRLRADPETAHAFGAAYDHPPDKASLIDALVTYERSLVTPDSRFDRWLKGDDTALSTEELNGYGLFKSLGCISCHQGVNVGGNLFERHGIFHPLAASKPDVLRVPSLRNVAITGPYFHDGSSATLDDAVRRMGFAQLDQTLSDQQVRSIVAFLGTLTGNYRGVPLVAGPR